MRRLHTEVERCVLVGRVRICLASMLNNKNQSYLSVRSPGQTKHRVVRTYRGQELVIFVLIGVLGASHEQHVLYIQKLKMRARKSSQKTSIQGYRMQILSSPVENAILMIVASMAGQYVKKRRDRVKLRRT